MAELRPQLEDASTPAPHWPVCNKFNTLKGSEDQGKTLGSEHPVIDGKSGGLKTVSSQKPKTRPDPTGFLQLDTHVVCLPALQQTGY